jgi:hypothetical protein
MPCLLYSVAETVMSTTFDLNREGFQKYHLSTEPPWFVSLEEGFVRYI